jgi:hypothetical protein
MITLAGAGAIIENDNRHVFLVKTERRNMVRWELPTRIQRRGETIFLTLHNCINEESSAQLAARIKRPVCLALHPSSQNGRQFFGIFFECSEEGRGVRLTEYTSADLPKGTRQKILDAKFVDWQKIEPGAFHPQHRAILERWNNNRDGSLFAVLTDADSEVSFYNNGTEVESIFIDPGEFSPTPIKAKAQHPVFISYSRNDADFLKELLTMLAPAIQDGEIESWDDRDIEPGDPWLTEILEAMERAKFAILLVSTSFLNSEFIKDTEIPKLLELMKTKGLRIIPVHKEHTFYNKTELGKLQSANDPKNPVDSFKGPERNKAIHDVAKNILDIVTSV